jgi:hypothetical protein
MSPATAIGSDELDLLDWKRHIFELYAEIRASDDRPAAWRRWCGVRDELFREHPQSPVGEADRESFPGARYAPYRPELATVGELVPSDGRPVDVGTSTGTPIRFRAFADVRFQLSGEHCSLPVYWLEGYGGGLFLPFGDATNGDTTYGGGRYLLDTSRAPTWARWTAASCSTSTSRTTRPAPTTRAGRARSRPSTAGWRSRSTRASCCLPSDATERDEGSDPLSQPAWKIGV